MLGAAVVGAPVVTGHVHDGVVAGHVHAVAAGVHPVVHGNGAVVADGVQAVVVHATVDSGDFDPGDTDS